MKKKDQKDWFIDLKDLFCGSNNTKMDEIILFLNQMEGYAAQRSEFWASKARQIIKAGRLANPDDVRGWLKENAGHGEFALLRNTPEDALDVVLEILINLQE